eukprot:594919-Hanusia_phi.AAC.1
MEMEIAKKNMEMEKNMEKEIAKKNMEMEMTKKNMEMEITKKLQDSRHLIGITEQYYKYRLSFITQRYAMCSGARLSTSDVVYGGWGLIKA